MTVVQDIRRITIRVSPDLHRRMGKLAAKRTMSLNTLAVEAMEAYTKAPMTATERFPLKELAALLAPAAEAADISEEDLQRHVREVRRRIWQERYQETVREFSNEPDVVL